jgi:type IV pilus assembly protein PilQ
MTNKLPSTNSKLQLRGRALAAVLSLLAGTTTALGQSQSQDEPAIDPSQVRVDDAMTVDLHVKDEDLANVLEMLSIQSQKNIIASKDVQARVTANLYGVTFYEALDAILNVNGYGYIEDGNFIKIYTMEEITKMEAQARPKVSRMMELNYLASIDAAEFVKPLLSPEGQIKVNGKSTAFPALGETPVGGDDYASASILVVYDFEENVQQVEAMVKQIDTRPAQVLVEATILQTQLNEANALGVDFSILADMSFDEFLTAGPLGAVTSMLNGRAPGGTTRVPSGGGGTAVTSTVGNTASAGGVKIGVVSNDVSVFLRALDEVTDTTVLSNPKVMALNRQPARVLVGRKVGYLNTTSTDTATTQSVEFLDTGTQLYFRPFVTNEGMVRMELKPQVSEAAIRQVADATGAAVTIPDEITNELTTNVLVRDGQTVVLGGLFRESITNTRKQVPLLGDIPIIGQAFRGNDDNTNRNEIIFLITPTILNDAMMGDQGTRGADHVDRVVTGARNGVLFFSRDKMTNHWNVEAERLMREGKNERALTLLERSLYLNPHQSEVIEMRERLTGKKVPQTQRSFLERVLKREASQSLIQVEGAEPLSSNTPGNSSAFNASGDSYASAPSVPVQTYGANFNDNSQPVQPGVIAAIEQSLASDEVRVETGIPQDEFASALAAQQAQQGLGGQEQQVQDQQIQQWAQQDSLQANAESVAIESSSNTLADQDANAGLSQLASASSSFAPQAAPVENSGQSWAGESQASQSYASNSRPLVNQANNSDQLLKDFVSTSPMGGWWMGPTGFTGNWYGFFQAMDQYQMNNQNQILTGVTEQR